MQRTGPEVVRHTAAQQRMRGTETDSDGKTKNDGAEAGPHAAAHVLQGTQAGSITQALNSSNLCSHAIGKVGVRVCGGGDCRVSPATLWPWWRWGTSLTGSG